MVKRAIVLVFGCGLICFLNQLVNFESKMPTLFWVRFMWYNNEIFHWTKGTRWAELHNSLPVGF